MKARLTGIALAIVLVALGVVLGAGPLQGDPDRLERQVARQQGALAERDRQVEALLGAAGLAGAYVDATTAQVLAGRLTNRSVAVISVAGLDPALLGAAESAVVAAGARVGGRVVLGEKLLGPSSQGLVEALSSQIVQETPGLQVASAADGYDRVAALLARAVGLPPTGTGASAAALPADEVSMSILAGLQAAELVREVKVESRSGLALIVAPEDLAPEEGQILSRVVQGVARGVPSVLLGPAPEPGSVVALLREDEAVASTVEDLEDPLGVVLAVLALAERSAGGRGDYGPSRGDDGLPPLS